ncbi:MAG: exodeoxyribonuclease VII large subunit [Candidatus Cloacimonetes bacterium]|nr:exodeoxyribonuclease VII large subunit [Candidatus Cloacimonadota bacterium]
MQLKLKPRTRDKRVFSVSELTSYIKIHLESKFPTIYLEGEVSNLTFQSSGHVYFTLKDSGASISCVMFRSNTKNGSDILQRGKKVCVVGSLRVYEPRGNYQIVASRIELKGQGALFAEYERRKKDFEARGWFSQDLKKDLPKYPKSIAIITSPTGAVIRDFWNVVRRRQTKGLEVHLYPVRVQGDQAAEEIKSAIELINEINKDDLIVIARGGGSIEDLWPFNENMVVEAVHYSRLPIVSAVGHETDFTLCDFVSDLRASTPSVAGELVVSDSKTITDKVKSYTQTLSYLLQSNIEYKGLRLSPYKKSKLKDIFLRQIEKRMMDLDFTQRDLSELMMKSFDTKKREFLDLGGDRPSLIHLLELYLERLRSQFSNVNLKRVFQDLDLVILSNKKDLKKSLLQSFYRMEMILVDRKQRLEIINERLMAHSPQGILSKGYTLLSDKQECVYSVDQLKREKSYNLQFSDGSARVEIKEIHHGKEK